MADVEAATATLVLRHDVSTNELASFTLEEYGDDHVRSRDIVFHRHSDAEPTFMNVGSALYDTLQFPLLHPYGGTTWHFGCKVNGRKISLAEYTKYLHLQDPHRRLERLGRLTEEILLDTEWRQSLRNSQRIHTVGDISLSLSDVTARPSLRLCTIVNPFRSYQPASVQLSPSRIHAVTRSVCCCCYWSATVSCLLLPAACCY